MGVCHQACRFISLHGWRAVNHLSTNEEQDVADSSRKAKRFAFLLLQDSMICVGQLVEVLAHCLGADAN